MSLDVDKLTVRFGGLTAVSQVDLHVEPGKIYSVIGPNGAGKTTVFNAITGIYQPTSGDIRFQGKRLERPLSAWVVIGCLLVGLLTAAGAALFMGNVDKLWRAAIRRNLYDPDRPFTYANAWRGGWSFLRGELGLERQRNGAWWVTSPDGSQLLATAETRQQAEKAREYLEELSALLQTDRDAIERRIVERADYAAVFSPDGRELARYRTKELAMPKLDALQRLPAQRRAFTAMLVVSLLGGFLLGSAGALAIWFRARRTPDVVALGGLARTFQNIRLFQNMTVLENVLVGMDRKFSNNLLAILLHLPSTSRQEREFRRQATELLEFVGLSNRRQMIAANLPYGDQRRLEIARALATEPKLLLLDEPAAGMNPAESDDLMKLVKKIRDRGITVVLIEHHMKLVMNISDRIAVLDHGEKIAEGTPAEVKAHPQVIEAYLGKEEIH